MQPYKAINIQLLAKLLPVETQENEWNEAPHVQLFAARSYWTQTSSYENEASFLFRFTQPEGGYQ